MWRHVALGGVNLQDWSQLLGVRTCVYERMSACACRPVCERTYLRVLCARMHVWLCRRVHDHTLECMCERALV